MSDETALATVEQKQVEFYGDELTAVRGQDGKVYVSVTHLCNALGLDRPSQVKRIQRHKIMSEGYQRGVIMTPVRSAQEAGLLLKSLLTMNYLNKNTSQP